MIKKILTLLLLCVGYHFLSLFCNAQTDGFSVARIHSELPYNPSWETEPLCSLEQQQLHSLLAQPFRYLGFGGQCYAFVSEDGKYVVKFFKHRIRKPFSYFYNASLPKALDSIRTKKYNKALAKQQRDFTSYKIAYETLREETEVLFVHLNKENLKLPQLTIIDKIGISHTIDLNAVEFIVQKKAELAYDHIERLMKIQDEAHAREAIRSLLGVIVERCRKGIFDEDPPIHRNLGFIGERAIFIDVGRFRSDPSRKNPEVYQKDLHQITKRFRHFLEEKHPSLTTILDQEIHALENSSCTQNDSKFGF